MVNNMQSVKWNYNMKFNLNFIFIIFSILIQASSGIFGKYAALSTENFNPLTTVINTFYLLSILCLILQAIFWQQALVHYPLSFAYPFMSLVNFVILISSHFLFQEGISINNIFGLIFISCGIAILALNSGASI